MIGKRELADAMHGHIHEAARPPELFKEFEIEEDTLAAAIGAIWNARNDAGMKMLESVGTELVYKAGFLDGFLIAIKAVHALTHMRCESCGCWLNRPDDYDEIVEQAVAEAREKVSGELELDLEKLSALVVPLCSDCSDRSVKSMTAHLN